MLEAIELFLQQFRRAGRNGIEVLTSLVQHFGGHPDRRQWRTQLMRDIGNESLLNRRQLLERVDLFLQLGGHVVH